MKNKDIPIAFQLLGVLAACVHLCHINMSHIACLCSWGFTHLPPTQKSKSNGYSSWWRQTVLPSLSLFTSIGTLLCCALPALLVVLGMGASLAGLLGAAPWITAVSEYKGVVFFAAGAFITLSAIMQWRARHQPCPTDPAKARLCSRMRKMSWVILGIASLLFIIGFFFAFVAVHIFY